MTLRFQGPCDFPTCSPEEVCRHANRQEKTVRALRAGILEEFSKPGTSC